MRLPTFPTFLRTLYAFSNTTIHRVPSPFSATSARPTIGGLKSISWPAVPFMGALFSTAQSRDMSHPVEKSASEWQAQLSPGMSLEDAIAW